MSDLSQVYMSIFFLDTFLGGPFLFFFISCLACVGLPRRVRVRVRVNAVGPLCLPVFLRTRLFLVFDPRLSLLFFLLLSFRMCVSARLFVSVLWSWSWSYLVLVLDLVLILIMVLALISCSLGRGLTWGFVFGLVGWSLVLPSWCWS